MSIQSMKTTLVAGKTLTLDDMKVVGAFLNSQERESAAKDAEIERLTKELAFRDFAQARESSIALSYGTYNEIQKALSSETALHNAWMKRANEAEAENASLKAQVKRLSAPVSDEEKAQFALHYVRLVQPDRQEPTMLVQNVNRFIASRAAKEK